MPIGIEENPNDLRETLEAATTAAEEAEIDLPENNPGDPSVDEPAPETSPADEQEPDPTAPEIKSEAKPDVAKPGPNDKSVDVVKSEAKPDVAKPGPNDKAPGTWTPLAREKWATVPPEVREEVWKREREASRAMTISAEARRFQTDFAQTIQPYLGFIAAENSTPLQAVNHMMQTAAALRVGTPAQKVELVAGIIKNFAIDLEALDSVMAGQQPQFDPRTQVQELVRQQMAPMIQAFQQQRTQTQHQEARLEQEVTNELEQFAMDPKNEFYWDVKDVMADLMEVASRRGQEIGLTEAYQRATLVHEPVRRVIEARQQRQKGQQNTRQAANARRAASSIVPSSEAEVVNPAPANSVRAAIEAAIDAQQGR